MARKKKEPTNEQVIGCQTVPSPTEGDGTTQVTKENIDQQENLFEEGSQDKKEVETKKTEFQDAQGRLITTEEPSPYATVEERFEEVAVGGIQPVGSIPDYQRSTDLKYPILAKTPFGYFCLEGWNLVEETKKIGKVTLKCFIEEIEKHSDEELAIRKVVLREKPRGGISSYGESVRNVTYLQDILTASELDPRVFHHGGARRGPAFTDSKQENITKLLSERLGKSESTIVKYLYHGFLLTDETLNFLAEKEADKDFFEAAQKNKRWMITDLKSQGLSDDDIGLQISESMLEWFRQYEEKSKKIERIWDQAVVDNKDVNLTEATPAPPPPLPQETSPSEVSLPPSLGRETCDESPPSTEAFEENYSFETIKLSVAAVASRLVEANNLSDPKEYFECIRVEAKNLAILLEKASIRKSKGLALAEEVS